MPITIRDVAKKANVSVSTVSRVLNGKDRVKDETREKILSVIQETSFVTNFSARTLRGTKTYTIGVVVPDITVPFYTEIIKGIENKANESDYKLVVCDTHNNIEKQRSFIRFLYDGSIDGMIFVMPELFKYELDKVRNDGYSVAVLGHNTEENNIPSITVDNRKGAYDAVRHLYSHGYTRIAFMGNKIGEYDREFDYEHHDYERMDGYLEALRDSNLEIRKEYIQNGQYCVEGASSAFFRLMRLENPPNAIFCANDEMALGVLKTAKKNKIRIPQDIGVIGFDNIRMCQYTDPSLTSVSSHSYNMGMLICEKLLYNIDHKDLDLKSTNMVLKPELILRESCGC